MAFLKSMSQRESLMTLSAGVFVAVIILWLGVYEPMATRKEVLKRKIKVKSEELLEVSALSGRIVTEKRHLERFESALKKQPEGFSSLARMENLATKAGMRKNITSMSPQASTDIGGYKESSINIKVEKVSLPQLVMFLESMRGSGSILRIKRISIKPKYEDASILDVSMSVASYNTVK
ncbi:hypothetical protein MNBD_NITROSPINAE04-954 [hydrothermal vent metagenome]|uniref:General secretion pathway protein M n=1 Tax=hydrothermal vent metagenome TaxID=652676 RepID=A0A3B1C146_9ZZZZ